MEVANWLLPLGPVVAIAGYFGPWIAHETAALTITGAELAEAVKFYPQVQSGAAAITRELFFAPLVAAAILLGLLVNRPTGGSELPLGLRLRLPLTGLALLFCLAVLPPYQYLTDPFYRVQLGLAIAMALATVLTLFARHLSRRIWANLIIDLSMFGLGLGLWQFMRFYALVPSVYDASPPLGWGLIACALGYMMIILGGGLTFVFASLGSSPPGS